MVTGNIKFDLASPTAVIAADWYRQLHLSTRFVWVAASTHLGEDALLLSVHKRLLAVCPSAMLILVPRHPERFESVYRESLVSFPSTLMRSKAPLSAWRAAEVVIGDSMGELLYYYQAADVAFIGGSLIERGGHNPIEAAILSRPILLGPHTFNFAEIVDALLVAGGAYQCEDTEQLLQQLMSWAENREDRDKVGANAAKFARDNQGALMRTLQLLAPNDW
jgi:3-deoxy-D-manno-octulosonic-acid transferase